LDHNSTPSFNQYLNNYTCLIVDTDFIATVDRCRSAWEGIALAYEARGLNVARNLALAIRWNIRKTTLKSYDGRIETASKHIEKFDELYREDVKGYIEKFLLLT
jgi:hypothetical protein